MDESWGYQGQGCNHCFDGFVNSIFIGHGKQQKIDFTKPQWLQELSPTHLTNRMMQLCSAQPVVQTK